MDEREVVKAVGTVTVRELRLWVRAGWVAPAAGGERGPVFDELDLARIRLVAQLRRDLALNADAVPVVLGLMDQLYGLRRELRSLARAVADQPEPVRERIRNARLGKR